MLSAAQLAILRSYWRSARPAPWLFPACSPDKPIDVRVLHSACRSEATTAALTFKSHDPRRNERKRPATKRSSQIVQKALSPTNAAAAKFPGSCGCLAGRRFQIIRKAPDQFVGFACLVRG